MSSSLFRVELKRNYYNNRYYIYVRQDGLSKVPIDVRSIGEALGIIEYIINCGELPDRGASFGEELKKIVFDKTAFKFLSEFKKTITESLDCRGVKVSVLPSVMFDFEYPEILDTKGVLKKEN